MIQRAGASPVLRVPALVVIPQCPDQRCRFRVEHFEPRMRLEGALKCVRSACRTRWLIEPIEAGSVRRQLEDALYDPTIANDLMLRMRLPESIDVPMYLQIPLTSELWDGYVRDADRTRSRTRRLVSRFLDSLHRRAS